MSLKDNLLNLKKKLLKNGNTINEKMEEFESDSENKTLIDKILDEATIKFFPKEGSWKRYCFKKSNDVEMINLPCHLRDNEWLAMMLRENQKLYYLSVNRIYKYVTTSKFFEEKRHEYELEIVKWQINWMKNDGDGWICSGKYGTDLGMLMPTCDLWFRQGVVDTLSAIGMDFEVIEEGIEKHADLWRDSYMKKAFKNKFEPVFYNYIKLPQNLTLNIGYSDNSYIPSVDNDHEEKWLKMRRYEYYQNHKDSVDKYGIATDGMLMPQEEAEELEKELEILNEERLEVLEQYKGKQKIISIK